MAEQLAALGLPVFLYGELASTPERRERGYFRDGGFEALRERMLADELVPGSWGPGGRTRRPAGSSSPRARRSRRSTSSWPAPILGEAAAIAAGCARRAAARPASARSRSSSGTGRMQISTNVHDPAFVTLGQIVDIDPAPGSRAGARPVAAELVGLIPEAALDGYPEHVPIPATSTRIAAPSRRTCGRLEP